MLLYLKNINACIELLELNVKMINYLSSNLFLAIIVCVIIFCLINS